MAEDRAATLGADGPAPGGDPSMEDILASIRRILNEDEPVVTGPEPPSAPEPLNLTEDMLVPEAGGAKAPPLVPETEITELEAPETETPELKAPEPETPESEMAQPMAALPADASSPLPIQPSAPPGFAAEALLAPAAAAAASASIGNLMRAVSQDRGASVTRGGPSIEDVVREELRPLLKAWLDQYLPEMVERLVQSEIERVARRGMG